MGNAKDHQGQSVLGLAVVHGHTLVVHRLLGSERSLPEICLGEGIGPSEGHYGLIKKAAEIRRQKTEVALQRQPPCWSPGTSEAILGVDDDGRGPLALAVVSQQPNLIPVLLAYRASVHARDHEGSTALMLAASMG